MAASSSKPQHVLLAGATGSIGESSLSVLSEHPKRFQIFGLSAHKNAGKLYKLCVKYQPQHAVITCPSAFKDFHDLCTTGARAWQGQAHCGPQVLAELAACEEVDTLIAAITGGAGLKSTFAAVQAGKRVLLANKEALVMAGSLMMDSACASKAALLPVDSEHNAIFQSLPLAYHRDYGKAGDKDFQRYGIKKLLLTGSGGPFRERDRSNLIDVSPEEAVAHPNWSMGAKISVDSATMANKGLELIEAMHLFGCSADEIDVIIHPQSIVHSMVQFTDGSVVSQMGEPDMRTPIAHCLAYPDRISSPVKPLDIISAKRLDFEAPDYQRFPMLAMARDVAGCCQSAMIAYNAANEIAVERFLNAKAGFLDIDYIVSKVLDQHATSELATIDDVLDLDQTIRAKARAISCARS